MYRIRDSSSAKCIRPRMTVKQHNNIISYHFIYIIFYFAKGLQEFMSYLEKEYSLENIKFWLAVNNFKKCTESEIIRNSTDIYK